MAPDHGVTPSYMRMFITQPAVQNVVLKYTLGARGSGRRMEATVMLSSAAGITVADLFTCLERERVRHCTGADEYTDMRTLQPWRPGFPADHDMDIHAAVLIVGKGISLSKFQRFITTWRSMGRH